MCQSSTRCGGEYKQNVVSLKEQSSDCPNNLHTSILFPLSPHSSIIHPTKSHLYVKTTTLLFQRLSPAGENHISLRQNGVLVSTHSWVFRSLLVLLAYSLPLTSITNFHHSPPASLQSPFPALRRWPGFLLYWENWSCHKWSSLSVSSMPLLLAASTPTLFSFLLNKATRQPQHPSPLGLYSISDPPPSHVLNDSSMLLFSILTPRHLLAIILSVSSSPSQLNVSNGNPNSSCPLPHHWSAPKPMKSCSTYNSQRHGHHTPESTFLLTS